MKNYRGNMLLIELIVVILFFSLSQLVVVRLFAAAHNTATQSELLSDALLSGESLAEQLSNEESPDALLLRLGFVGENGSYVMSHPQGYDLLVSLRRERSAAGEMLYATVTAQAAGEELFSLPVNHYLPGEAQP